jgi:hypothetical protein
MADLSEHQRIFGRIDPLDRGNGRSRKCRYCGDWHSLERPWPSNCREPAPPRNPHLKTPILAPTFEAFVAGPHDAPVVINDRREKGSFMDRHDLVEFDAGVTPPPLPTAREWKAEFVADFKRAAETDPLNRPPVDVIGRTDLDGAAEVDVSTIEVAQ